ASRASSVWAANKARQATPNSSAPAGGVIQLKGFSGGLRSVFITCYGNAAYISASGFVACTFVTKSPYG
ncbi:hypothetical protein, partial [Alishewanella longhuensis]|uniref:hypothetical protein n=1 Tax=Alishewanella longhuensis TaxID=1091037 RepID=UPI001E4C1797